MRAYHGCSTGGQCSTFGWFCPGASWLVFQSDVISFWQIFPVRSALMDFNLSSEIVIAQSRKNVEQHLKTRLQRWNEIKPEIRAVIHFCWVHLWRLLFILFIYCTSQLCSAFESSCIPWHQSPHSNLLIHSFFKEGILVYLSPTDVPFVRKAQPRVFFKLRYPLAMTNLCIVEVGRGVGCQE